MISYYSFFHSFKIIVSLKLERRPMELALSLPLIYGIPIRLATFSTFRYSTQHPQFKGGKADFSSQFAEVSAGSSVGQHGRGLWQRIAHAMEDQKLERKAKRNKPLKATLTANYLSYQ